MRPAELYRDVGEKCLMYIIYSWKISDHSRQSKKIPREFLSLRTFHVFLCNIDIDSIVIEKYREILK